MKSMTGYGKATLVNENITIEVEIKSVNSRFHDIRIKLPAELNDLEINLTNHIKSKIHRGKIDCKISISDNRLPEVVIDEKKADFWGRNIKKISKKMETQLTVPIDIIYTDLNIITTKTNFTEHDKKLVVTVFNMAIEKHQKMAYNEGNRMKTDILNSLTNAEIAIKNIQSCFPAYKKETYDNLRKNVEKMLGEKLDKDKLKDIAIETAYYYEKSDVNEEIKRLYSHFKIFMDTVNNKSENIGKKLAFILQEMHREINTIGSKFSTKVSFPHILIVKEEIEKCREMVQNVE